MDSTLPTGPAPGVSEEIGVKIANNAGKPGLEESSSNTPDQTREKSLKGTKLEKGKLLTGSTEAGEGRYFELTAEQDEKIYLESIRIQRIIEQLKNENPNHPNIARLHSMLVRTLGSDQVPSDFRNRAEEIVKKRDERTSQNKKKPRFDDEYRIFSGSGAEERLAVALAVVEVDELLTTEAYGYTLTNGGTRPLELALPKNLDDIEIILQKAIPSLPKRFGKSIKEAIIAKDNRVFRTLIRAVTGELGGAAAGQVIGTIVGSLPGQEPAQAQATGRTIGMIVGWSAGVVSANWDLRLDQKGDQFVISLTTAKTDSRIISSYADQSGVLGWAPDKIGGHLQSLEDLRLRIYRQIGLDLQSKEQLAMADLDLNALDPAANTVSRGAGLIHFDNQRQIELSKIIDSLHASSLFNLSPEKRLEAILQSYDNAAGNFCSSEMSAVLDELNKKSQPVRESEADALERYATELESGRSRTKPPNEEDIQKRKDEKIAVDRRSQLLSEQKTILDETTKLIPDVENTFDAAKAKREVLRTAYETVGSRTTKRSVLDDLVNDFDQAGREIVRLTGEISTLESTIQIKTTEIGKIDSEIHKLETQKGKISTEETNPNTGNKYTADEAKAEITRLTNELGALTNQKQNLETERNNSLADKKQKDKDLATVIQKKDSSGSKVETIQDKILTADTELAAESAKLDKLVKKRQKILQDYFDWTGGTTPEPKPEEIIDNVEDAKKKGIDLTTEITKLEKDLTDYKEGKGEATKEDKDHAKALKMIAEISRAENNGGKIGKLNEIEMSITAGRISIDDLGNKTDITAWVQLLLGPTASPEERELAARILSKAIMVETAVNSYHLDADEFFGIDHTTGSSRYSLVRENTNRIAQQKQKIEDLRVRRENANVRYTPVGTSTATLVTWEDQIKTAEEIIGKLQDANYRNLSDLYSQIAPLFTRNRFETADFTRELIDRLRQKALVDPFAQTTNVIREESMVREIGTTVNTEHGRVTFDPQLVTGGVEEYHQSIRVTTPVHYKIPTGQEVKIILETQVKKPENVASLDRINLSTTLFLDASLYNALPSTKNALVTDWPPVFDDLYDSSGNKKPMDQVDLGRYLNSQILLPDMSLVQRVLDRWNGLGNLEFLYPQATGQAYMELDNPDREKYFSHFTSMGLAFGSEFITITRNPDGSVAVNFSPAAGTTPTQTIPLSEFNHKFEEHFRKIKGIPATRNLTSAEISDMRGEKSIISINLGRNLLHSTLQY